MSEYECPNEDCDNPLDSSAIESLKGDEYYICPNCGDVKCFLDDDGDVDYGWATKEEKTQRKKDQKKAELEAKKQAELKAEKQAELEAEEGLRQAELEAEMEQPDGQFTPPPAGKRKKLSRNKTDRQRKPVAFGTAEYRDFFLDRPEGVSIEYMMVHFGIDKQQAHYIQRKTFKDSERKGYEVEKRRVEKDMKKLFFIRDNNC